MSVQDNSKYPILTKLIDDVANIQEDNKINEAARIEAEKLRVQTETTRVNEFNNIKSEFENTITHEVFNPQEVIVNIAKTNDLQNQIDDVNSQLLDIAPQINDLQNNKAEKAEVVVKANQSDLETERARINNLVANAGNTDGNAELQDLRVGANAITYPTAGDMARAIAKGDGITNEFADNLIGSYNLCDFSKINIGYYLTDGTTQDTLVSASNRAYSDFISIKKSKTYCFYGQFGVSQLASLYDENKNFICTLYKEGIQGVYGNYNYTVGTYNYSGRSDTNAKYIRFNMNYSATNQLSTMFVEGANYPTIYTKYSEDILSSKFKNVFDIRVTNLISEDNKENALTEIVNNLCDISKITKDLYLTTNDATVALSGRAYSDYIPVNKGETICFRGQYGVSQQGIAYDKEKKYICVLDSSGLGGSYAGGFLTYTPGSYSNGLDIDVAFVRVNMSYTNKLSTMVVKGTTFPTAYKPYEVVIHDTNLKKAVGILTGTDSVDVISYGDSLTAGAGGTPYTTFLQTSMGTDGVKGYVFNHGVGGEGSDQIACRQGAIPLIIQPFTLPANGSYVPITANINFRSQDSDVLGINPVYLDGIECTIVAKDSSYTQLQVKRNVITSSDTVFTRPVEAVKYSYLYERNKIQVIWIGTNDTSKTVEQIISNQEKMVRNLLNDRYIILGLTCKSYHPDIVVKNQAMYDKWGNHFLDIRQYLLDYGLADAGIAPTAQDTTDMANGEIPSSLRSDSVHFNTAGYTVIANVIYKKLKAINYFS